MNYNRKLKICSISILFIWLAACGMSLPSTNGGRPTSPMLDEATEEGPSGETPDEVMFSTTPSPTASTAGVAVPSNKTPVPTSPEISSTGATPTRAQTGVVDPTGASTLLPGTRSVSFPLAGPLVAFGVEGADENYLVFFDVGSAAFREIHNDFVDFPFQLAWFDRGCYVYVSGALLDLEGNPVWTLPELNWENLRRQGSWGVGTTWLSPDRAWLAFSELSGDQTFFDAEVVNLSTVSLDAPEISVRVSTNGGARAAAWSSDGKWLAFTDHDEQGVLQIYRAKPDGQIVEQVTNHTEPVGSVPYLVWSPDDKKIAYHTVSRNEEGQHPSGWVGIVTLESMASVRVSPNDFSGVNLDQLYWSQDGSRLMFLGETDLQPGQIYWVDASNGIIVDSVSPRETSVDYFDNLFLAGSLDSIAIQNYVDYYVLNRESREFELLTSYEPEGYFLVREARSAPISFPGETACR